MELTRCCLLVLGLLFIFLGSETGQAIYQRTFQIVRFMFYITLALLAAVGAIFFAKLGRMLSGYSDRKRPVQKN